MSRAGVRSRPDRDGKKHDIHGGEAGNGRGAQQAAHLRIAVSILRLGECCFVAGFSKRFDHRRHGAVPPPLHCDTFCSQVHPRGNDALELAERAFDRADAACAMRLRERKSPSAWCHRRDRGSQRSPPAGRSRAPGPIIRAASVPGAQQLIDQPSGRATAR